MTAKTENSLPAAPARLPALDGLRAFAIFLVLARHALLPFQSGTGYGLLDDTLFPWLFSNGWIGVDLFFVLSGFLIARPLMDRSRVPLRLYLAKRALRILPAYYVALLLGAFGLVPLFQPHDPQVWPALGWHLLLLQDYTGASINIAFWSLGVEEKFYLLMPLLAIGAFRRGPRTLLALSLGIAALSPLLRGLTYAGMDGPLSYSAFFHSLRAPFHSCLEPLFFGVAIAAWQRLGGTTERIARRLFVIGALGLGWILWGSGNRLAEITAYDAVLQPVFIAAFSALLVAGAVFSGAPRWLQGAFLAWWGRMSFTLYLVHIMMLPAALAICRHLPAELAANPPLTFTVFVFVYLVLSVAAALLLHHLVERPGLTLKRRLEDRHAGRVPA